MIKPRAYKKNPQQGVKDRVTLCAIAAVLTTTAFFSYLISHSSAINKPYCDGSKREIDWTGVDVSVLSANDIMSYIKWGNRSSCRRAQDFGGSVFHIGADGQKALCLDEPVRLDNTNGNECLVYSFGIHDEWSFDEAMEQFGCRVFSFDPSMNDTNHDHSSKIHFYRMGLWHTNEVINIMGVEWTMRTLEHLYHDLFKHSGRIIDYLKVDIESSEWTVIPEILSSGMMDKVRQLGLEIHMSVEDELVEYQRRASVIKSLEDYGMIRFDSKYNEMSYSDETVVNYTGYLAYELAWYNGRLAR